MNTNAFKTLLAAVIVGIVLSVATGLVGLVLPGGEVSSTVAALAFGAGFVGTLVYTYFSKRQW